MFLGPRRMSGVSLVSIGEEKSDRSILRPPLLVISLVAKVTVRFQLVSLNGRAKRNTKCIANIKPAGVANSNSLSTRVNRNKSGWKQVGSGLYFQ